MATISLPIQISPSYASQTIGYRVLNLDRTEYSAYTTTGVVDLGGGFFSVTGGVTVPDEGSYIQVLENDGVTLITETGSDAVGPAAISVPGMPGVNPGAPVPGVDFALMRGDTTGFAINNLDIQPGDIFICTVKPLGGVDKWYDMVDDSATFQVRNDGLHVFNGIDVSATRLNEASMAVDEALGEVLITFMPSASDELRLGKHVFDLQRLRSPDGVVTVTWGMIDILADVTRRIS